MQKWDSTVLNINDTCKRLGEKSLQVLGMHALSSYSCGKGKVSAIKALSKTDLSELDTFWEIQAQLMQSSWNVHANSSLFSSDFNPQYQWKMLV